jgi:opacity protein-like surface antigen
MARGRLVAVLLQALVLVLALALAPSAAAGDPPAEGEARAEPSQAPSPAALSSVIFASLEAGPAKTFAAVGWKRALSGTLATSGFRSMVKIGGSKELASRVPPHGFAHKSEAQALLGYEWRLGDSFLALYAGSDLEAEQRRQAGRRFMRSVQGARLQADLWATPYDGAMLQASAYLSTVDRRLWARLAAGLLLPAQARPSWLDGVHLGPEAEFFRQRGYTKLRLGLHATGLRLFGLSWRVSAGLEQAAGRSELYGTLGLHWLR